jgi:tetratricopeptide (TPR) repeat protein
MLRMFRKPVKAKGREAATVERPVVRLRVWIGFKTRFEGIAEKEAKTTEHRTVGSQRISIELKKESEKTTKYIERYNGLVSDIAGILREMNIAQGDEEKFFTEVWSVIYSNLKIKYGKGKHGFLSESLETNRWNCDTSVFLVFDVGRALGTELEIVDLPEHTLIAGKSFYFETAQYKYSEYHPIEELQNEYPVIYGRLREDKKIMSLAYYNMGHVYEAQGKYKKAFGCYNKAIEINPEDADIYDGRGFAYGELGEYDKALRDYGMAIEINPKDATAYYHKGIVYWKLGKYEQAPDEFSSAIKIDPEDADHYQMRGRARLRMREVKGAAVDFIKGYWFGLKKPVNAAADFIKEYGFRLKKAVKAQFYSSHL